MKLVLRTPNIYALLSFSIYVCVVICSFAFLPKEYISTMIFYYFVLTLSLFFVSMYSLEVNNDKNTILLWLSMFVFGLIMATRAQTGIDDEVYLTLFYNAGNHSLINYLSISDVEIGYKIVIWILNRVTGGNYDITQSLITYFSFFMLGKTLLLNYKTNNMPIFVLFIWTHYYFLIMGAGLVRIFIAISIVAYALYYVYNPKKYALIILAASLFHMSSLIMLLLLLLNWNGGWFSKNWRMFIVFLCICVPIAFLFVAKILVPLLGSRYSGYSSVNDFSLSLGSFDTLPVFLFGLFFEKSIPDEKYGQYVVNMVLVALSSIFSVFASMVSLGRLVFYSNLGIVMLSSQIFNVKPKNVFQSAIRIALIVYAIFYFMYTGILSGSHIENLFPYRTFLGDMVF